MTPPLTPEERRAEWFAGKSEPVVVPCHNGTDCPICGLRLVPVWPGDAECPPCAACWDETGRGWLSWWSVNSDPDHPLHSPAGVQQ